MTDVGVHRSRRNDLPLRQGSGRVAAIRACVNERDVNELRALVDVVLNAVAPAGTYDPDAKRKSLAALGPTSFTTAAAVPAPTYAAAATTALPQPTLVLPAPSAAAAAAEVVDAPVFIKTRAPRHRPWRSKGSGRCPHGRQVQLDLSGLITAAVAWEESQRQQQAAKAAAEAAAAVTRAAAVTPGNMRAAAAAATPASASRWSPIEGIPELRSRPPRRRPAAAAATPNDLTFTPMEGVPETARGFRRAPATAAPPSRAPVPRFEFTPIEGVPEKAAMGSASAGFAAARMQRAVDAAAADDDNDGGYDGDYDDGGWNDMAQAAQHVSSVVQGIANASPLTPSVPLQLAQSGATARRTASRVAAAAAAAGGSQGPSPLHLTPAEQEVAAAAKKRRRLPAQTPREGRWAKSRKSLASDGMKTGEDGRRQSTRVRHAPLEYWRNERKELCRVHKSLPTVRRITERTPDPAWPAPAAELVKRQNAELVQRQNARSKPRSKAAAAPSASTATASTSSK